MKNYSQLSKTELKHLLRLRLKNEPSRLPQFSKPYTIQNITINSITNEPNLFGVEYIVTTKEWSDDIQRIVFDKFYPNEFLYLQSKGINFALKNTCKH